MDWENNLDPEVLFDLESERRVLSAMMHSEYACTECLNSLDSESFYQPQHGIIFNLIRSLYERDIRPTFVELLQEGSKLGALPHSNDIENLRFIAEYFVQEENINYWIKRVKDKAKTRRFVRFLRQNSELLSGADVDVEQMLLKAEEELTNMTALEIDDHIDSPEDLATLGYDEVEKRYFRYKEINEVHKGVIPLYGLPTGFENLNKLTLGYNPGDLIILGAQTGHGKTSFALHTARAIAIGERKNLLYLNTEMSREQIALRWGSILSNIEHDKVRSGELSSNELTKIYAGYALLRESGFYSYPCPNLTPEKNISIARKFKTQKNIDMMIVDYVGRMDKQDPRLQEWQILEQIVKTQKLLAQNLNMVVMCLVQLNPDGSLQGAKRMKNECDLMLKLSPISKEEQEENDELKKYNIMPNYSIFVEKNRDGQSGIRIPIYFDLAKQTMHNVERVSL